MKKRILILTLTLTLLLALGITGSLAYLTHKDQATNSLSYGDVTISIEETFRPPSSLNVGDNEYQKVVRFRNTGSKDAYVRVAMSLSEEDVAELTSVKMTDADSWHSWLSYPQWLTTERSGWIYHSDIYGDYYYYTKILKPNEVTTPLITRVNTHFNAKTADTNDTVNQTPRDYSIYLYAEGVQAARLMSMDGVYETDHLVRPNADGSLNEQNYKTAWERFLSFK